MRYKGTDPYEERRVYYGESKGKIWSVYRVCLLAARKAV